MMPRRIAPPLRLAAALLLAAPAAARAQTADSVPAATACEEGRDLGSGVCVNAGLLVDGFANLRGGVRRGAVALGQLTAATTVDLGEALSPALDGWRFGASVVGIYGRQPTANLVGSLAAVSNAEALSAPRLSALWLERGWEDVLSLRAGQLAVDTEFTVAEAAENLVNGTFGWPVGLATSLPSGGVAYPFAAPGARLALGAPDKGTGLRMGVFSGDPAGRPGEGTDPQRHNRFGTTFSFSGGTFLIVEAVTGGTAEDGPRPWTAKLGAWTLRRGGFDSQRLDSAGLSLADPDAGPPRRFANNQGVYGVGEATLWREGQRNLALFARAFAQPGDRNLVSLQTDAGLAWRGAFGRDDETLSLGASLARIGRDARRLDQDAAAFSDARPERDHELVLEANYDVALAGGGLHLRPGLQWLLHPAARTIDDREPGRPLKNAVVAGLRLQAGF